MTPPTMRPKGALLYRLIATAMRETTSPLADLEILAMVENHVVRSPDPMKEKDDILLGLVYVLSGLMLEAAFEAGRTREEAAMDVAVLADMLETGRLPE